MPPRPRFVILEHDHPARHWDFMLEANGVLWTWRLPEPPRHGEMTAERIADHRLAYLDYEGPISGNRGSVQRWQCGTYELSQPGGRLDLRLFGQSWSACVHMEVIDGAVWRCEWTL